MPMKNLAEYLKHNVMFVVILSAIVLITAVITVYELVNQSATVQTQDGNQQEPSQPQDVEASETAIIGFNGRLGSNDVIVLTWQIESGERKVLSSALYYVDDEKGDIWLADVTNHTSYQLSQDAYQFKGGENHFKIICTLDDDKQIEATTSVEVVRVTDVEFKRQYTENGMYLMLSYSCPKGYNVDIPIVSFYGNSDNAFSMHYENSESTETDEGTVTTVTYLLQNDKAATGTYHFTVTFRFLQLNQSYEYKIDYEKGGQDQQEDLKGGDGLDS